MVIYELLVNQAEKKGRIPHDAKLVLEEICLRMKEDLKESLLQGQCRLEKEFMALTLGNRPHSEFRARFEEKIDEMDEYDCQPPEDALFRAYGAKIGTPLLNDVKYRGWSFPGDEVGSPQRQPKTWQELAHVVCKILQNRSDAQAPSKFETALKIHDKPSVPDPHEVPRPPKKQKVNEKQDKVKMTTSFNAGKCSYCKKEGHFDPVCPSKYTHEVTKDAVKLTQAARSSGKGCTLLWIFRSQERTS